MIRALLLDFGEGMKKFSTTYTFSKSVGLSVSRPQKSVVLVVCRHLRWLPSWRLMSNTSANFRVVQMSSLAYPTGFWASSLPRRRPPTSQRGSQIFSTTLKFAVLLLIRRHDGSQ